MQYLLFDVKSFGGLDHHIALLLLPKWWLKTESTVCLMLFLQRRIYGLKGRNIDVFAENSSLAINPRYVRSWLDLLSRTPRVAPFLQKNDPFIAALKKVLDGWFRRSHISVVLWRDMTLVVFWCRNCPSTRLMCMFKVMRLKACSLSMIQLKRL